MNLTDWHPEIGKFLSAACGSFVSLKFLPGGWLQKAHMWVAGGSLSWFASAPLAKWSGMEEGTAGLFIGVFGMAIVSKIFETLAKTEIAGTVDEWIRKTIGLPPRLPKD